MCGKSNFAFAFVCLFLGTQCMAQDKLAVDIEEPDDSASTGHRPVVEGRVTEPKASVWVVVHPIDVSGYWVQPNVTVRNNGAWKVKIYIGRSGDQDVGKSFEIMAFANPGQDLREGLVLNNWPESEATSDVVEITRE